jgi:hypothetical protein
LRDALAVFSSPGRSEDQDIVAAARTIVYFPDEDIFEHRYTGDYYKCQDDVLWPTSIGGMKPVWRPHAKRVGAALRDCKKLQDRTSVIIYLGRDNLKTEEATLFCTKAGVVWRYVGPDWDPTMTDSHEIEVGANVMYGAYLDEVAYAESETLAVEALSALMTGVVRLDAYGIMSEATAQGDAIALLANRVSAISFQVKPWYPPNVIRG